MFVEKIYYLSLGAHVLHATSNLIIWRRCQGENGEEIYQTHECGVLVDVVVVVADGGAAQRLGRGKRVVSSGFNSTTLCK